MNVISYRALGDAAIQEQGKSLKIHRPQFFKEALKNYAVIKVCIVIHGICIICCLSDMLSG